VLNGSPKVESMKIIHRNEKVPRGVYGGGIGHFGFNGDCTFCIPIRSLFTNDKFAYIQTSSGIVFDSNAKKEYQEIIHKLSAMKKVLDELSN
jgi:anthranilate synthase component 1